MVVLLRPFRVSHWCELFRTGAKVLFRVGLATIYAFVPRATNTNLAFRVDLATNYALVPRGATNTKFAFRVDLATIYAFVQPPAQYDRVRKLYICVDLPKSYRYEEFRTSANRLVSRGQRASGVVHRPKERIFKFRDRQNHAWVQTGAACS